jgi:tRNA pseudouridine38-40 synthase
MESELQRYFIFLTFRGEAYHGWQRQSNAISVQEVLEKALGTITGVDTKLTGAGRTDTGVHANYYCAHFDSNSNDLDQRKDLVHRLNCFLPKDIAVSSIRKVIQGANARFSAMSRTYSYNIITKKDPFLEDSAWLINQVPDIALMNHACQILKKYTDFTSFARLHGGSKTNDCILYEAEWTSQGNIICFTIKADRFLRNMVRAITGTIVEVGTGKMTIKEFESIINKKNRCAAGYSAPAKGLFLTAIEYPSEIFIS